MRIHKYQLEFRQMGGHVEVYLNGRFQYSADDIAEAKTDLETGVEVFEQGRNRKIDSCTNGVDYKVSRYSSQSVTVYHHGHVSKR